MATTFYQATYQEYEPGYDPHDGQWETITVGYFTSETVAQNAVKNKQKPKVIPIIAYDTLTERADLAAAAKAKLSAAERSALGLRD